MVRQTCGECRHFEGHDEMQGKAGSCLRYPPTVQYDPEDEDFFSAVPFVASGDRACGEFCGPLN